jgi:hypothetical protein
MHVPPCGFIIDRRFGGTLHFHLQGRIIRARKSVRRLLTHCRTFLRDVISQKTPFFMQNRFVNRRLHLTRYFTQALHIIRCMNESVAFCMSPSVNCFSRTCQTALHRAFSFECVPALLAAILWASFIWPQGRRIGVGNC